jgi:hypothetical protein
MAVVILERIKPMSGHQNRLKAALVAAESRVVLLDPTVGNLGPMDDCPEDAYDLLEEAQSLLHSPAADDVANALEEVLKDQFATLGTIEAAIEKAVTQLRSACS